MVHTAHHHLAGVAQRAATAAAGRPHTEALARPLGRRVRNACGSRWANDSARARRIHVIMTHACRVGLSCSRQALAVEVAGVIRAKGVALEGILTRQQMATLVHLFSHLIIERSGRPST